MPSCKVLHFYETNQVFLGLKELTEVKSTFLLLITINKPHTLCTVITSTKFNQSTVPHDGCWSSIFLISKFNAGAHCSSLNGVSLSFRLPLKKNTQD